MTSFYFLLLCIAFLIMALPLPLIIMLGVMIVFLLLDTYFIFVKKCHPDCNYLVWMVLFTLFCSLSALWSINVKFSYLAVLTKMMPVYSVTLFIYLYARTYHNLEIVLKAFYISAIIFLVYVFSVVDMSMIGEGRLTTAVADSDVAEGLNSNYIAGRMVIAIYAGYFVFWKIGKSNFFLKLFHLLLCLVMIYVILVSGSRTSLGLLILPLFVYFFMKKGSMLIKCLGIAIAIGVFYFVVMKVPYFYDIIGERVEDVFDIANGSDDGNEDVSRLILMQLGLDWFIEKPILGYGINCFRMLSYHSPWFSDYFYAHNNYIELMVDVGIIGLIIYYLSYIMIYSNYRKCHLRNNGVGIVVISLLIVMMFSDMFWVGYYNNMSQFLLCIAFALVHIECQNNSINA